MIRRRSTRLLGAVAAVSLIAAACGDDDDDATDGTEEPTETDAGGTEPTEATEPSEGTEPPEGTEPTEATEPTEDTEGGEGGAGWTVNTDDCIDPDAANAPIEDTVVIGQTLPLSGGPAATAFAPVAVGMQAYIDYANENGLLEGYELELRQSDDQYNPAATPDAVNGLLDDGVDIFSGMIGSPNNLAVMELLNEECVPQLLALSGVTDLGDDVAGNPWTIGGQTAYKVEAAAYAQAIAEQFPEGTVGMFLTNSEFGQTYKDAFNEVSGEYGLEVVEEQSVEATDTAPPTAQVNALASAAPDAILAVPLGAGCPAFLSELANAKAANAGWEPAVYITNTCASGLILAAAGETADGVFTSAYNGLHDVGNPEEASLPGVSDYIAYMESIGETEVMVTAGAGWNTGEVTVEILNRAAASPDGLTRASIINAARNFEYHPSLARDGADFKSAGEEDGFLAEAIQIIQFDFATTTWTTIGDMILDFETS